MGGCDGKLLRQSASKKKQCSIGQGFVCPPLAVLEMAADRLMTAMAVTDSLIIMLLLEQ
jgi:hypothetical protein